MKWVRACVRSMSARGISGGYRFLPGRRYEMVSDSMNVKQRSGAAPLNGSMQRVGDITNDTAPEATLSDTQAAGHLPAVLSTRDLTVLMLLIVLFIANTTGVQFVGPSAFIYGVMGLCTKRRRHGGGTRGLAQRSKILGPACGCTPQNVG